MELSEGNDDIRPSEDGDAQTSQLVDDDEQTTLFKIDLEIVVKDFTNQKSGVSKGSYQIHCDTLEDFCQILWSGVEQFIEKEIIFNDESQSYDYMYEELIYNDLERFVAFQDKISKRSYEVMHLTTKLLHGWKNKKGLICFVHAYGHNLKKKQQYEQAYKQAIQPDATDRAGAVTNTEIFNCIDDLKNLHHGLLGTEASWLRWANWIKKHPGHERDSLMRSDPPKNPNLFGLFTLASETDRMKEIRSGISIGKRVNESIASALPLIEAEVDVLVEVFKSGLCRAERMKTLVEGLKSQLSNNENLMQGFNEALGSSEDEFSRTLLNDIDNVDDVDHELP